MSSTGCRDQVLWCIWWELRLNHLQIRVLVEHPMDHRICLGFSKGTEAVNKDTAWRELLIGTGEE